MRKSGTSQHKLQPIDQTSFVSDAAFSTGCLLSPSTTSSSSSSSCNHIVQQLPLKRSPISLCARTESIIITDGIIIELFRIVPATGEEGLVHAYCPKSDVLRQRCSSFQHSLPRKAAQVRSAAAVASFQPPPSSSSERCESIQPPTRHIPSPVAGGTAFRLSVHSGETAFRSLARSLGESLSSLSLSLTARDDNIYGSPSVMTETP
jgi:hypothetical protein